MALLCFVHRGMPAIERTMKEHGLIGVHYTILTSLSDAPDRTMRLSDLANRANFSQSRLTHRMKTLIDRNFVKIVVDESDKRAKNATMTETGFKWLETVAPLHAEDVQRIVFDHLTPAELKALTSGLSKIADGLIDGAHEA